MDELLAKIEEITLDADADEPGDVVDVLFRVFHTIKGASAMVGFQDVASYTHHLESLLDKVRVGRLALSPEILALVLASKDQIAALIAAESGGAPADPATTAALLARVDASAVRATIAPNARAQAAPERRAYAIRLRGRPGVWPDAASLVAVFLELGSLGECSIALDATSVPSLDVLDVDRCAVGWSIAITTDASAEELRDCFIFVESELEVDVRAVDVAPESAPAPVVQAATPQSPSPPLPKAPPAKTPAGKSAPAKESGAQVKVSSEKLDRLVNLVGELVICRSRIAEVAGRLHDPELGTAAEEVERLVAELRESVLGVRMMPIGSTFGRFKRLVHDLSSQLGKHVDLVTEGAETELDKSVLDQLVDPLMHLIRNSLDHGIEPNAVRAERGKPEHGTIRLVAAHAGQHVVVTIQDDGKGLDPDAIREKAIERGLLTADQVLPPGELYKLIFLPGFSTAKQVSDVSGRGVGMDVVKRQIEALRGTVTITSTRGAGTTIELRLPLTLAIIDGLLVEVAGERYIVPLGAVTETVELPYGDRERHNGRRAVKVRGELVPYVSLRDSFGVTGEAPANEKAIILQEGDDRVGVIVDVVLGSHQTVIQSLGRMYTNVEVVSGATIMGDGRVALILDIGGVVRMARSTACEPRALPRAA